MLTIQELEALRGLVSITININLPKGHHMAYDQTRIPGTWLPLSITADDVIVGASLNLSLPAGTTMFTVDANEMKAFAILEGNDLSSVFGGRLIKIGTDGLNIFGLPDLTVCDFHNLAEVGGELAVWSCPSLSVVNLSHLSIIKSNVIMAGNAFSESQVDAILLMLVNATTDGVTPWGSGFGVDLSGGTNAIPSATGLASKATLEGRGATVTVNS